MVDNALTLGVLTPHVTPGPELEIPLMTSGHIRTQVSRIPLPDGTGLTSGQRLRRGASPSAVEEAAAALTTGSLDALAYASTSSGYVIGVDAEADLVGRLGDRWAVPVASSSLAAVQALHAYGVERLTVVHPPWFDDETDDLGGAYFRSRGFHVVVMRAEALPGDPAMVRPDSVVEWAGHHLDGRADAVFFGGNGFHAAGAVEEIERRTGLLVLEANQVLVWAILALSAQQLGITAYGRLFRDALLPTDSAGSAPGEA
jgi:maleate isomerase